MNYFVKATSNYIFLIVLLLTLLVVNSGCEDQKLTSLMDDETIEGTDPRVEVLLYHSLEPGGSDTWPVIDPELFCRQIQLLLDEGWQPLTLEEYAAWGKEKKELNEDSFLLTFDDGAESIYEYAFPFLVRNEIPAAVYLIAKHHDPNYESDETIWVPKLTNDQIEEMYHSNLVTFQSHSYDLHRIVDDEPLALNVCSDKVLDDFLKSAEVIGELTGEDVYSIAYPYGATDCAIVKAAERAGFRLGFVLNGEEDHDADLLQLNRISLDNYSLNEFKDYFDIM